MLVYIRGEKMKKFIYLTLLLLIISGCSQEVTVDHDKYIRENSIACIENLQKNQYIQACKDLESESVEYISKVELEKLEPNTKLFENIIKDLTVVSDVSENTNIANKAKEVKDSIINITKPISKQLNIDNYKQIKDEEQFKTLINSFENMTTLSYSYTDKYRLTYDNKDIAYKTVFIDENMINLTYHLNQDKVIEKIEISNNSAEQVLYYNFAKQYTNYILKNQLSMPTRSANHDALLVEQILQFNNDGEFLSSVKIIVEDETVIIEPI